MLTVKRQFFLPPATTYNYAEIDSVKLFYREAGDKSNPTIVLLHGYPSSSHSYRNLIPMLATHYHVIAPDNLGSGYSTHLDPKHTRILLICWQLYRKAYKYTYK